MSIGAGDSEGTSDSDSARSGAGPDSRGAECDDEGAGLDAVERPPTVHYYVDVPHSEDMAYAACERNAHVDTECHNHLQEESGIADINTFLALSEIIPARERRRQQPLLDFTKSRILTSHAYTESCERLLAQKEALQAKAKRKAEIREATKETRRQEKEEKQGQVRARKEARAAKKLEKERSLLEKRATTARHRLSAAQGTESPPRSPRLSNGQRGAAFPRPAQGGLGASAHCPELQLTRPPTLSTTPALSNPLLPQTAWPQDSLQPSPLFWNNPMLPVPHMFQHPLPFSPHNGNSP